MRIWTTMFALTLTATLAACGSVGDPDAPGDDPTTRAPDAMQVTEPAAVDPEQELVGLGIVMQRSADAAPELCVGAVAESYPPQCGGPVLAGAFSWDDVEAQQQDDIRWTDTPYYAVGHLDLATGGQGTLTLTRPLSPEAPEGFETPDHEDVMFPQLCDDPTGDVPDVDQAARTADGTGMAEEQELIVVAQELDGYVTAYFSDGGPTMNVVINSDGDLDEARSALRAVFTGPLCVAQRDAPAESDVRAAQEALGERFEELRVLSAGGSGTTGMLEVEVLVADPTTIEGVHETVARWLEPSQVNITSTLRALDP